MIDLEVKFENELMDLKYELRRIEEIYPNIKADAKNEEYDLWECDFEYACAISEYSSILHAIKEVKKRIKKLKK